MKIHRYAMNFHGAFYAQNEELKAKTCRKAGLGGRK
jgi:hypothetical protein